MRKTLQELAAYLKEVTLPETGENYAIKPQYLEIGEAESIRQGVLSFRAFLMDFYDELIDKGGAYDHHTKIAHEYENRTTISGYYPFLYNVKTLLMRIGYYGKLMENAEMLACGGNVFNEKLSAAKTAQCVAFLIDCGFVFDGIDMSEKKPDFLGIENLRVSYPANPPLLTGMKVMAVAELSYGTLVNQDVFMRCDDTVLKNEDMDAIVVLRNTIRPLAPAVQEFVLLLHERYLKKGVRCIVEIKGFHIYLKYQYKRKDVWGVNASLNNGYHINVKPLKRQEYADTIYTFPAFLQETIAKEYGCGRKRPEIVHCDGGCRGLIIPLDDSVLEIRDFIVTWFDEELSWRDKK